MKRILTSVAAAAVLAAGSATAAEGQGGTDQGKNSCPGLMNPAGPAKRTCPVGGLAERYGYPAPADVLAAVENKQLRVTRPQYQALMRLAQGTEQTANQLEKNLVSTRAALRQAFASGRMNNMMLTRMLGRLYTVKRNLRHVHLSARVNTRNILAPPQMRALKQAGPAAGGHGSGGMGPGQMGPSGMMAPGMMGGQMGSGMSHGTMRGGMTGMQGMSGMQVMTGMQGMSGMMGGMMGGM